MDRFLAWSQRVWRKIHDCFAAFDRRQEAGRGGEDMLLKKAIEVVTNGKSEVVSAPRGAGNSETSPGLTPLNVPRPNKQQ